MTAMDQYALLTGIDEDLIEDAIPPVWLGEATQMPTRKRFAEAYNRFMRSGAVAAVLSVVVSCAVLLAIVWGGHGGLIGGPPAGSDTEYSRPVESESTTEPVTAPVTESETEAGTGLHISAPDPQSAADEALYAVFPHLVGVDLSEFDCSTMQLDLYPNNTYVRYTFCIGGIKTGESYQLGFTPEGDGFRLINWEGSNEKKYFPYRGWATPAAVEAAKEELFRQSGGEHDDMVVYITISGSGELLLVGERIVPDPETEHRKWYIYSVPIQTE